MFKIASVGHFKESFNKDFKWGLVVSEMINGANKFIAKPKKEIVYDDTWCMFEFEDIK